MGSLSRILIAAGAALLLLAGVALALLFRFQERLIFFPEPLPADYRFPEAAEERWIDTSVGRAHSLFVPARDSKGVILYFHGNAGNLASWGEVAFDIAGRTGWSVWIVDYPGYGKSPGRVESEEQLHTIAREWLSRARGEFPNARIALYGRSLGSGIALKLASEEACDRLVLESPYYSIARMASELFPLVPAFVLRYRFLSHQWLVNARCPVLVVHGTKDEVIPFAHAEDLVAATKPATHFVAISGGGHNDLEAFPEYWSALSAFLR